MRKEEVLVLSFSRFSVFSLSNFEVAHKVFSLFFCETRSRLKEKKEEFPWSGALDRQKNDEVCCCTLYTLSVV